MTEYSPAKTGGYLRLLKTGSLDNAIREFIDLAIMVCELLYHDLQKWQAYARVFGPFFIVV